MARADNRFPNISQICFHTIAVMLLYYCPSYIEIQRLVLLYLRIIPVFSDAFFDIPLTNVHNLGIWPPVPDNINTTGFIVEILVVQIYEIEFAPEIADTLCPFQAQ